MPGQRFASLTARCASNNSFNNVYLRLNGVVESFLLQPFGTAQVVAGRLVAAIQQKLTDTGQASSYSLLSRPAADPAFWEVVVTGTTYASTQDFTGSSGPAGIALVEQLDAIKPVFIAYTRTLATCFGSSTGTIGLTITNGTTEPSGPYTYLWDDGVTTANRSGLPAGPYGVRTTDTATGAYAEATVVVGQNPQLVVTLARVGTGLQSTVAGGVAPYTYLWDDASTGPDRANVVGAVTYTLTVTDANGCSQDASLRFELLRYWFSGNAIPLALDAGAAYRADPTTKPDLRFACEVFVERDYLSGAFERVGPVLEQPADAGGRTTFEVQELLEPYVAHHLPAVRQPYIAPATGLFCRFYLRHYEITTAGPGAAVTLDDNYLLRGGLDFAEAARATWFSSYQARQLPFLTWEPATKAVLADQPEYLYCLVPRADVTELRYCLRLLFEDGSTADVLQATRFDVRVFEVYCLPAGYQQLGLIDYESTSQVLQSWEVVVKDQNDVAVTERRTFELDRRAVPTRRYFHYANSLGGVNTLCARGRAQQQDATTTLSGEVARASGYNPLDGDVAITRKTKLPTLKCYAGARDVAQQLADQDFLLSEKVVLLDVDRYRAGTVKDRTHTPLDEYDTRRVLEFDFELPRERFYTPRLS
ncbi:SprB repeat-containing protein [Hymenobacter sp. M29]|uniref:SprB repeat-containing protein n=1 Tax=Hymenobacter mellowenesis TaxID=3063995 RepID=A0ABT9AH84_9BACT|nr:SprB repeat-containing protein [Hymenobacter sp. M29]MDO7849240.1 SprB repeat-containing protein [Hymenobacter sp. M29]